MSTVLAQISRVLSPVPAVAIAAIGAVAGGLAYLSLSGVLLGALYALAFCGVVSTLASLLALAAGVSDDGFTSGAVLEAKPVLQTASTFAPQPATGAVAQVSGKTMASTHTMGGHASHAFNPASPAALAPAAPEKPIPSTPTSKAAIPAMEIQSTETEAQLLAAGKFAEYHLAKAKRFFADKNFKEAAYQAAASISHGDIPEAVEIRKAALAAK